MNNFIRTFHPVGQGAFYTEKYVNNGETVNIVYDCGTSTHPSNDILVDNIFSSFRDGEDIDILFISHFDDDHINGISILKNRCHIKNVIIPLIKDEDKIIFKICNYFSSHNHQINNELIDSPESYFGYKTKVIKVRSLSEQDEIDDSIFRPVYIDTLGESAEIASGQLIQIMDNVPWYYIPFNYEYQKRALRFEEELEKANIKNSELNSIDFISSRVEEMRKLYKIIPGNINTNSLVLFSGTCIEQSIRDSICDTPYIPTNHHLLFCAHSLLSGCLYLGDASLNTKLISQLKRRLRKTFWQSISVIQVPHHGSKNNFSETMLDMHPHSVWVVSYGTENKYKHPSTEIISMIMGKYSFLYKVTENEESILYQQIKF